MLSRCPFQMWESFTLNRTNVIYFFFSYIFKASFAAVNIQKGNIAESLSVPTCLFFILSVVSFSAFDTFSHIFFSHTGHLSLSGTICLTLSVVLSSSPLCSVSHVVVSHLSRSILSCTNVEPSSIYNVTDSSWLLHRDVSALRPAANLGPNIWGLFDKLSFCT